MRGEEVKGGRKGRRYVLYKAREELIARKRVEQKKEE